MRRALASLVVLVVFVGSLGVAASAFYDDVEETTFDESESFEVQYNERINLSAHNIDNATACCPVVYNQTGDQVPTDEYEFYENDVQIEISDASESLDEGETASIEYEYTAKPELERQYAALFGGLFDLGGVALLLLAGAGAVVGALVALVGLSSSSRSRGGGGR